MSEIDDVEARPTDPVGRVLYKITHALTLFGGFMLCAMGALTTISVTGRYFFDAPITGDFEIIAIGTGVGVFAFLPHCQLMRENVIVDFFLSGTSRRCQAFFDTIGNLTYALIMTLMAWRLPIGGMDIYKTSQSTLILGIPQWSTFPLAILCLFILLAVCVYTTIRSFNEMRLGRTL
jgi:TRAP-type C4-dicarboxylate transport system permease small subunit